MEDITVHEHQIILALRAIAARGNDAEIRPTKDGNYKIYELTKIRILG